MLKTQSGRRSRTVLYFIAVLLVQLPGLFGWLANVIEADTFAIINGALTTLAAMGGIWLRTMTGEPLAGRGPDTLTMPPVTVPDEPLRSQTGRHGRPGRASVLALAVLVLAMMLAVACSGVWSRVPGAQLQERADGRVWEIDCRTKFEEVIDPHPTKPRPAGLVRFKCDGVLLPLEVTADDVGLAGGVR